MGAGGRRGSGTGVRRGDRADHGGNRNRGDGPDPVGVGVGVGVSASASFRAGAAQVDVRAIAPAVPAAVRTQLAAEQAALASAGRQLLGNKNIHASPSCRTALADGRVDARLLAILSLLSAQLPVRLVAFIGAPGAGSGAPLRGAEIGVASPSARSAVVGLLDAQQGLYRPAAVTVIGGGSPAAVAVRFDGRPT